MSGYRVFLSLFTIIPAVVLAATVGCSPQAEKAPATGQASAQDEGGWKVIGPGGGGAQFEPTINPHDPDHVFVRCDMTGAYVTYNAGESWRMFNLRTVVRDYEFDPHDPNTVYASNSGLYRSTDRGRRWRLILPDSADVTAETMSGDHAGQRFVTTSGLPGGSISKVRVDPAQAGRIYVAVSSRGRGGSGSRILVSEDNGISWKELAEVSGGGQVLAIFPGLWYGKPDEVTIISQSGIARFGDGAGQETTNLSLPADQITAADGGFDGTGSVIYVLAGGGRFGSGELYRSTDMGESWQRADKALYDALPEGEDQISFRHFAVSEGNPGTVYVSCSSYPVLMNGYVQRKGGIIKTSDSGANWDWVLETSGGEVLSDNFEQGWLKRNLGWFRNPSFVGVSPTDPNVVYCTDSGRTYRTLDGGTSWRQVNSRDLPDRSFTTRGLDVTTNYGVHFDPYNPDHYFITYTDIGLFHTFNSGWSWFHSITGIPQQWRNTCYWLEFDPAVKGRIFSVWSNVHDLPRPKMFRSGNLTNGNQQGGAAVSGDGGRYWRTLNIGTFEDGWFKDRMRLSAVPTHIVIDTDSPVRSRTLYVCDFGYGVWKSSDGGKTWFVKNKGISKSNLNAWRITRLPDGRLILLVARGGIEGREMIPGAMYTSDDGAESWQTLALPGRVTAPNDLVFDPSDPKRMYLSCWPLNVGSREIDGKQQRARIVEGDQLEVGNKEIGGGLYRTEDGGKSWRQVFDETMHVYAAAIDPQNPSTVLINTFNSAAFRSDDRGETWKKLGGYNFKWGHRPVVDPHNPGMLFLTTFGGSVYYGPSSGIDGAFEDIENLPAQRW
ncbi:MAG: hypothetical protein FVQ81_17275 [Candidatus Glassbacteria bacterium]|nr:hypothetical protein [Candidatus Glassbacteria bacterium]